MASRPSASTASGHKFERVADASVATQFTAGCCQALYVSGAGDIEPTDADGNALDKFDAVPAGTILPIQCWGVGANSAAVAVTAIFNN